MFIDYGNIEDVSFQNIRQIVRDFTQPDSPLVLSMCNLDGKWNSVVIFV